MRDRGRAPTRCQIPRPGPCGLGEPDAAHQESAREWPGTRSGPRARPVVSRLRTSTESLRLGREREARLRPGGATTWAVLPGVWSGLRHRLYIWEIWGGGRRAASLCPFRTLKLQPTLPIHSVTTPFWVVQQVNKKDQVVRCVFRKYSPGSHRILITPLISYEFGARPFISLGSCGSGGA